MKPVLVKLANPERARIKRAGLPTVTDAELEQRGGYAACIKATPEILKKMDHPDAPKFHITQCEYCHCDVIRAESTPKSVTPVCHDCLVAVIQAIGKIPLEKQQCKN